MTDWAILSVIFCLNTALNEVRAKRRRISTPAKELQRFFCKYRMTK